MSDKSFIKFLKGALHHSPLKPIPVDGLANDELSVARRINIEIERAARYEVVAGSSMHVMERVELFYEKIIGVISAMIRVSMLSQTDRNSGTLCKNIVEIFSKEMDFDNCSIMLKDESGDNLVLIAGSGKGDKYKAGKTWHTGTLMKSDIGVAGKAFTTGKTIFVPDVDSDSLFTKSAMTVRIASILSVPIKAGDEVIGVINFSHPLRQELDERNMETLMLLLSGFVGQVITLSKLYSSMSHWNETLKEEVNKKTAELTKRNKQLRKIALIDPLTGIFNRRFFFKRLEEEFLRAKRHDVQFSLLFIDIDNLKPINDNYGHLVGDSVIKTLSKILRQIGRKGDVSCRLGGDEFGYILLESDLEGAYNFAMRLKEKFLKHNFKGISYMPTISIGIAHSKSAKFKDHKDFYGAADRALYDAKQIKNAVRLYSKKKNHNKFQLPLID